MNLFALELGSQDVEIVSEKAAVGPSTDRIAFLGGAYA